MGATGRPLARSGSWFKPELRTKNYGILGDAYEDEKYDALAKEWSVTSSKDDKYLILVKQASERKWIHLRLLADFMQIGHIPRDWAQIAIPTDRETRWARTRICVLDYTNTAMSPAKSVIENLKGKGMSTSKLRAELRIGPTQDCVFRLYVVEDLSRNVIEALGSEFEISPDFFRAHIADYAWYNVRDRWREPQPLEVARSERDWFQIRYVTTRYFASKVKKQEDDSGVPGCFETALEEAKNFNILRRPDDDKSRGWWDKKDAVVALTRSRATFWLKPKDSKNKTAVGVLLLDPTLKEGLPLWRGHHNFHPVPSTLEAFRQDVTSTWETPRYKEPRSFFEDFIYWAEHPQAIQPSRASASAPREHLPVQTLLHLVGAEWLTMCDYIKTRLNQIDLETVDPVHFAEKQHVDVALGKLHMWRRLIPLYREMVSETLHHVFGSSCVARGDFTDILRTSETPSASCPVSADQAMHTAHGRLLTTHATAPGSSSTINSYEQDFKFVLTYLQEYQERIDRLTSVVTAVMAVDDTRRANNDAHNIGRLTWLATFFIPFSVVSGIFSMQKLSEFDMDTIRVYFATTLPVAVVTVLFTWALQSPAVRTWLRTTKGLSTLVNGHEKE
ncbi:unnamed protein product [Discula destructiva]